MKKVKAGKSPKNITIPAEAAQKLTAGGFETEDGVKKPKSEETEQKQFDETVSSAPNEGAPMCAQPVVDAGHDSGVGHWEGDGPDIKFVKNEMSDNGQTRNETNPGVSKRSFNNDDHKAPNTEAK